MTHETSVMPASDPPTGVSSAEVIGRELPCASCEYDLRGLPTDGSCPECGLAIAESLKGKTLHHADPRWLRRLVISGWLVPAAVVVTIAVDLIRPLYFQNIGLSIFVTLTTAALLAAGPLLASLRPSPSRFDLVPWRRRSILIALAVAMMAVVARGVASAVYSWQHSGVATPVQGTSDPWIQVMRWTATVEFIVGGAVACLLCSYLVVVLHGLPRSRIATGFRIAGTMIAVGFATVLVAEVLQLAGVFAVPLAFNPGRSTT